MFINLSSENQTKQIFIPKEIIGEFFKYLDVLQLVKIRRVCKKWQSILTDLIWKRVEVENEQVEKRFSTYPPRWCLFARIYKKNTIERLAANPEKYLKEKINETYSNILNTFSADEKKCDDFIANCLQTKDDFLKSIHSFVKNSLCEMQKNTDDSMKNSRRCYQYLCLFPLHENLWIRVTIGKMEASSLIERKIEVCLDKFDETGKFTLKKEEIIAQDSIPYTLSGWMTEWSFQKTKTTVHQAKLTASLPSFRKAAISQGNGF